MESNKKRLQKKVSNCTTILTPSNCRTILTASILSNFRDSEMHYLLTSSRHADTFYKKGISKEENSWKKLEAQGVDPFPSSNTHYNIFDERISAETRQVMAITKMLERGTRAVFGYTK